MEPLNFNFDLPPAPKLPEIWVAPELVNAAVGTLLAIVALVFGLIFAPASLLGGDDQSVVATQDGDRKNSDSDNSALEQARKELEELKKKLDESDEKNLEQLKQQLEDLTEKFIASWSLVHSDARDSILEELKQISERAKNAKTTEDLVAISQDLDSLLDKAQTVSETDTPTDSPSTPSENEPVQPGTKVTPVATPEETSIQHAQHNSITTDFTFTWLGNSKCAISGISESGRARFNESVTTTSNGAESALNVDLPSEISIRTDNTLHSCTITDININEPQIETPIKISAWPEKLEKITKLTSDNKIDKFVLNGIDWPDSLRTIGSRAFANFRGLYTQQDSLPASWNNITTIGKEAFAVDDQPESGAYAISRTKIPNDWGNITRIEDGAFKNVVPLNLPSSWSKVTAIGNDAFNASGVYHPNYGTCNAPSSPYHFFRDRLALPDNWESVKFIGDNAFDPILFNKATLPSSWGSVKQIGSGAFRSIQSSLPSSWGSVSRIGDEAFACNKSNRELPQSWRQVKNLGAGAFENNTGLVSVPSSWGNISIIRERTFKKASINTLPSSWGKITAIGNEAFQENSAALSIPLTWGSIKTIGESSFQSANLKTFPSTWGNITNIGKFAFHRASLPTLPISFGQLTRINQESFSEAKYASKPKLQSWGSVTYIEHDAFASTSIELPNSWDKVETVDYRAFAWCDFHKLPREPGALKTIGAFAFFRVPIENFGALYGVEKIGVRAFAFNDDAPYKSNLSEPLRLTSITEIGEGAFQNSAVREIANFGNLKIVPDNAFRNTNMRRVDDMKRLSRISDSAFTGTPVENCIKTSYRSWTEFCAA